jgi:hypothetical protein
MVYHRFPGLATRIVKGPIYLLMPFTVLSQFQAVFATGIGVRAVQKHGRLATKNVLLLLSSSSSSLNLSCFVGKPTVSGVKSNWLLVSTLSGGMRTRKEGPTFDLN